MRTLLILMILCFSSNTVIISQEIIYSEIEKELNNDQKKVFDEAILILQKASGNENNADAIDYKYRKKRNSPKWELKTWEAKEQRILAERNYQQAYTMLSEVYSDVIKKSEYKTQSDKYKAQALDREAIEKFRTAKDILNKFQDISKIAMANTNYEMLNTELKKSRELKIEGIQDQISALKINREEISADVDKQDLAAWEKAISQNTVESYNEYLNNNPRGKYMSKANDMIRQIEKRSYAVANNKTQSTNYNPRRNIDNKNTDNNTSSNYTTNDLENKTNNRNNRTNNTNTNYNTRNNMNNTSPNEDGLVFKVQVAASMTTLSDWILSHKAPGADLIEEYKTSTWIKYTVGNFGTYQEAADYRDRLKNTAPDAFVVVFEKGKQIAVTEDMKM